MGCSPWGRKESDATKRLHFPYMWTLKRNDTSEVTKQKETHRLREQTYGCWEEGIDRDFGMNMYTLLYLKWITNKDLLYSTWNYA